MSDRKPTRFEEAAAEEKGGRSLALEFWDFLKSNKKWWLLPILITFLVLALLVFISSTGVAPFIYTLF